jgi:hypothetical protein
VSGSPARKSPQYRRNRATIRARGDPYARCAIEIEYDAPRYIVIDGVRRENPWRSIASHHPAGARGTEELYNLQAEHVRCSRTQAAGSACSSGTDFTGSMATTYLSRW